MESVITAEWICLVAGPIIALLVSAFKKVSVVQQYPKVIAGLLSALFAVVSGLTFMELDWAAIAVCTIGQFSAAVATYEVQKTLTSPTA